MDSTGSAPDAGSAARADAERRPRVLLVQSSTPIERRLIEGWLRGDGTADAATPPASPEAPAAAPQEDAPAAGPRERPGATPVADGGGGPTETTELPLAARALAESLVPRTDDPVIVPVKITWLPPERDGHRRARLSDVIALTNPRNPNRLIQRRIVDTAPDRWRVTTGTPARLDDLRRRFALGREAGPGEEGADGDAGGEGSRSAGPAHVPHDGADGSPAEAPTALARYIVRSAVVALERAERAVIGERYKVPRVVAEQIMDSPGFRTKVIELGRSRAMSEQESLAHAQESLGELVAVQSRLVGDIFTQIMRPLYGNAWTVDADESRLDELRRLNRQRPLVFLPSHRSYADAFVLGDVLARNDFPPNHLLGGANLQFWPIGAIAKRTGTVFIRRSFGDDAIYKASLEEYFAYLLAKRFNLEWYFEGGRTRTGKLRAPKYGLLAYVANAVRSNRVHDALLVPVSITYERMAEVGAVAAEQMGAEKQREGLTWMAKYARSQQRRAGNVYVRFGDPISLRDQLAAGGDPDVEHKGEAAVIEHGMRAADPIPSETTNPATAPPPDAGGSPVSIDADRSSGRPDDNTPLVDEERRMRSRLALQKLGFEIAVGINRATPVTINSLVTLALLGVRDRALTLDEVAAVIAPVRAYIERRRIPQGELSVLDDDAGLARVLRRLTDAGVVTTYDGGVEPVYAIEPGQHIVAAFYRNSGIHWFVNRAILELAIVYAHQGGFSDPARAGWEESKRLRDLLKFEFFFPERDTYEAELAAELELIAPEWNAALPSSDVVLDRLVHSGFFMAHRTLRSFFDAQLVVAERLAARDPATPFDKQRFLDECAAVGRQMLLQCRLHGPESLSLELFASAVQLADNRGLLGPGDDALTAAREAFADQLRAISKALAVTESLDVSNRKVSP